MGSTSDITRRLNQHRRGHTQTTKNMRGFEVALIQEFDSLTIVRRVENKIKKLKRKDYIEKIIKDGYIKIIV